MDTIYSIHDLTIKNFKCYGDNGHTLKFGEELTVIIGRNGAGKTALLNAVKKAVSIILARDRRKDVRFIGDAKYIRQNTIKDADARYNFDYSEGGEDYEFPVELKCNGIIRGENIKWNLNKPYKGAKFVMTFREALDLFLLPFNNGSIYPKLPVLSFFSDSFPHVRNDLSSYEKEILSNKSENPERRAGYYNWDDDNSDFHFWSGMFIKSYKKLNDTVTGLVPTKIQLNSSTNKNTELLNKRWENLQRSQNEITYVSDLLKEFSRPLSAYDSSVFEIESITAGHHLSSSGKEVDAIKLTFTNGETRYFDMLPEGYKRLLSIAFEIIYRHFVLNRNLILENPDCRPEGIVIIDEIELHLHPILAEEAIARLRKTFPDIQFIITTHSPTVISTVYNDGEKVRVIRLTDNHEFMLAEDCFEADYGTTLVMAMGAYNSMRYTQRLRQHYIDALHEGKNEEMQNIRRELTAFIGELNSTEEVADRIIRDWEDFK